MEYRKFNQTIIARMDKGEEILQKLQMVCEKEQIKLASVSALGAVGEFTVGLFDTAKKKYQSITKTGDFEIVSLTGTVNTMEGSYYAHIHMSVGDQEYHVFGGHLNRAVVSGTCEMVIQIIDGVVDRVYDKEVGLNIYRF